MICERMSPEEFYGIGDLFVGGHSTPKWYYELEEEDIPDIVDQIKEFIMESGELTTEDFTVFLYCEINADMAEFSINPYDYMTKEEMEKLL